MKNIISATAYLAAGLSLLISCDKSVRTELPSPEDRMHLTVSEESVVISFFSKDGAAVTFNWGESSFESQGRPVRTTFKMDISGNNFETSIDKIDVTDKKELSFTAAELKAFLDSWEIQDGNKVKIEAEVIAAPVETSSIEEQKYEKPEVSKVSFDLYCSQEELQLVVGEEKYSFVNNMLFAVVDAAGTYRCFSGEAYLEIELPEKGIWWFGLDYDNRTVSFARPQLWLLGDASLTGWDLGSMLEFAQSGEGNKIKTFEGLLFPGEMKFALSQNFEGNYNIPYLMPLQAGAPVSDGAIMFTPAGSPDNKWNVTQAGEYRVIVDMENMSVSFEKLSDKTLKWRNVWMVGDATSGGWNSQPFQIKLSYDYSNKQAGHPGVFIFDGWLNQGEFKFPLEESTSDWSLPFLMPKDVDAGGHALLPENGQSCAIKFVDKGGPDHKWLVESDRSGEYRLILDTEEMTMKVIKK